MCILLGVVLGVGSCWVMSLALSKLHYPHLKENSRKLRVIFNKEKTKQMMLLIDHRLPIQVVGYCLGLGDKVQTLDFNFLKELIPQLGREDLKGASLGQILVEVTYINVESNERQIYVPFSEDYTWKFNFQNDLKDMCGNTCQLHFNQIQRLDWIKRVLKIMTHDNVYMLRQDHLRKLLQ